MGLLLRKTVVFPNLNNMERNDIKVATGTQLETSLNLFITWMLSQYKTILDGKKKLRRITEVMLKTIGTVFVIDK